MKQSTAAFRTAYREQHIGPHYQGWLHMAFTVSMASLLCILCALQLNDVSTLEWMTIPFTFLYVNFAEYFGHRDVMHRRRAGFGLVYERHACQHHLFFTDEHMAFDATRDFKVVLFPPVLVTFFFVIFGTPVVLLLGWVTSSNVAYLFGMTAVGYFLNYELLHFSYHLSPEHWIARLPGMRVLRRLHTQHHDQTMMNKNNFNITYPIADYLLGTLKLDK
ncbi:MAG: fatty acid hydroxylase family protein [Pseudomonadota bacterium]